ncbi:ATP-grasp fold amidoligase family protein, partial [Ligaoa zhengdingensis]|uniref:ATP-grasp fold amidoligase family protein n=1 Tax=Ligaoa zhengdingensis TaxID=2763658 RepID=UPI0031BB6107
MEPYKQLYYNILIYRTPLNEKLQWLKLYNRHPKYTQMVDKIEVKKYVAKKIGEQYIIPTLGVWDTPVEFNFEMLPNKFVLKCN